MCFSVYLHYCIQEVLTLPYLKYLIEDNSRDYSIYRLMSSCHSCPHSDHWTKIFRLKKSVSRC